jgi:acylglycerol lipase
MAHREGSFKGLKDCNIYYQRWLPDGAPRAILLVAHGFGEHSGRYQNLVDYFQPLDYAIYALDHRGHGKSDGARVEVCDYADYVTDLKAFCDLVRKENAHEDIFLVGHSMGASIATAYAAQYQDELAGLILSGGGIATGKAPPRPAGLDLADTLSRDPAVVEAYRNDPLVYHGALPTGRDSAMAQMSERLPELAKMIRLPILVLAGAASPLGDGPRSEALFETVSSSDKTLKLYPGLLHEIFNEPEWPDVMHDMSAWLEKRI